MYGARGRIGLITLATDTSVLPEYVRAMPDGVAVYPAPIVLPRGEVTAAALAEMLADDQLERAAALLTWADVDVIVFACTTGSLVHGLGWDRELIARIERASGRSATTTTTAVLAALRAVEATSLAIATPYIDELNAIERLWLYLRERFLSHRLWPSYDDILAACSSAWTALRTETGRIRSLCSYDWARVQT